MWPDERLIFKQVMVARDGTANEFDFIAVAKAAPEIVVFGQADEDTSSTTISRYSSWSGSDSDLIAEAARLLKFSAP